MRKVLIGTPTYDGKLDVWYTDSLLRTVKLTEKEGIFLHAIYTSYDALIQRARNNLFRIALSENYDDLIFIDSDMQWSEDWILQLLNRPEDVVAAPVIGRSDNVRYNVTLTNNQLTYSKDKQLLKVDRVGTGLMKLSRKAMEALWLSSEEYLDDEGTAYRMICDIQIRDNSLISEDFILCEKWRDLGGDIWIDPTMNPVHTGSKRWQGNFQQFLQQNGYGKENIL